MAGLLAEDGLPAFFREWQDHRIALEHQIATLREPRPTSVDAFIDGRTRVAIEVKLTELEFGRCSRPQLRTANPNFQRDHCDGTYTVQRQRSERCALSEIGISYWKFVPEILTWSSLHDHRPCPFGLTYQLVRNILAVCVNSDSTVDLTRGHALVVYDARNPAFQPGGRAAAQWESVVSSLRQRQVLRRVSWQRLTDHLARSSDLAWLCAALRDKYGIN